ncbi:hypothetical protein WN943_006152 [Citrus x changshan-huyou]
MEEEINFLYKNETLELVKRSANKRVVGCKWIFKVKEGLTGSEPKRFKARLLAKGYAQKEGVDFKEVFSLVVKHASIRVILPLTAIQDMELDQLDVRTAFLYGKLQEEILMSQPERLKSSQCPTVDEEKHEMAGYCSRCEMNHEVYGITWEGALEGCEMDYKRSLEVVSSLLDSDTLYVFYWDRFEDCDASFDCGLPLVDWERLVVVPYYGDIQQLRDLIKFPSISIFDAALWRAATFTMIMSLGLCSGNKLWEIQALRLVELFPRLQWGFSWWFLYAFEGSDFFLSFSFCAKILAIVKALEIAVVKWCRHRIHLSSLAVTGNPTPKVWALMDESIANDSVLSCTAQPVTEKVQVENCWCCLSFVYSSVLFINRRILLAELREILANKSM